MGEVSDEVACGASGEVSSVVGGANGGGSDEVVCGATDEVSDEVACEVSGN